MNYGAWNKCDVPGLMEALGIATDDEVEVTYPHRRHKA
jgi:hypothetical protein